MNVTLLFGQLSPLHRERRSSECIGNRRSISSKPISALGLTNDLTARLADDAHRPFDLEQGPVLRVRVFTRSERDHVLLMVVHHIVIDFWSLAIVLNELSVLYPAHLARIPALLPEPIAQYSNYVRWQAEMLAGPQGQQLWKYWSGQLAGPLPELGLPSDRPRPPLQTYRGAALEFNLDAELSGHLRALGENPRCHSIHGLAGRIPDDSCLSNRPGTIC